MDESRFTSADYKTMTLFVYFMAGWLVGCLFRVCHFGSFDVMLCGLFLAGCLLRNNDMLISLTGGCVNFLVSHFAISMTLLIFNS
jgi:hypothetical protein